MAAVSSLALAQLNFGSWNVRGGLENLTSGKLEHLVSLANDQRLGILALQETWSRGRQLKVVQDGLGRDWTLATAGPLLGVQSQGTGFLVSPKYRVVSFKANSPRVSWILCEYASPDLEGYKGTAAFVSAYAPTEAKGTEEELTLFFSDVKAALSEARLAAGCMEVPLMGDFNVNLGDDRATVSDHQGTNAVLGPCLPAGVISSPNCSRVLWLCEEESLYVPQTFEHAQANGSLWTWRHPGFHQAHLKDLVLVPKKDQGSLRWVRAFDTDFASDHRLVVARVNSSREALTRQRQRLQDQKTMEEPKAEDKKRKNVFVPKGKVLRARFEQVLGGKLVGDDGGWPRTETALRQTLRQVAQEKEEKNRVNKQKATWLSERATRELSDLFAKRAAAVRRREHASVRAVKLRIRRVVQYHKSLYEKSCARRAAVVPLVNKKKGGVSKVPPEAMAAHLGSVYNKESQRDTLGLTAEKVGRNKAEPRKDLSGAPDASEVRSAIARLKADKAPGKDGLRSEVFKAGGETLVQRLTADFAQIWPSPENQDEERCRVFQSWQDALVIPVYKGKGAAREPTNSRGIFLLDVAGKILCTVVERRLRVLVDEWVSD